MIPIVIEAGKIYVKRGYNSNIISENMSVRHGTNLTDAWGWCGHGIGCLNNLDWIPMIYYISKIRNYPCWILQGKGNREIAICGKRVYSGSSQNNTCCAMWWAWHSHGHTVLQGQIPWEWNIISYYHRLYFSLFITLIYQDLVPLAAFRGFAGSWSWVIPVGIPPFPVFNEPPKYDK